ENFKVVRMDVFKFMEQCNDQFDFIFAGPPYALTTIDDIPKLVAEKKLVNENGWFILEHTPRNNYEGYPHFVTQRNYGTTIFSIFINKSEK
ncbi:MAG: RsmD family RNA methyltransferase, partial [Bacteroidetes bacterium]|nr:RsmD family RNA methyltransferase [Bacteroidota bacterium]